MYLPLLEHLFAVDMLTGVARLLLNARACISGITFLPDGSMLVHRGFALPQPFSQTVPPADQAQADSFGIYRLDGTLIRDVPAFAGYLTNGTMWADETPLACSPDGSLCAMPVVERAVDPQTGLPRTGNPATDERLLGRTTENASVLVWRLDGTLVHTIACGQGSVRSVAFSPDGSRLAVALIDGGEVPARVYSVAEGTLLVERRYTAGVF